MMKMTKVKILHLSLNQTETETEKESQGEVILKYRKLIIIIIIIRSSSSSSNKGIFTKRKRAQTEKDRQSKKNHQMKVASRKCDRARYKEYKKEMKGYIHPTAFGRMDDETMLAVRTNYLEFLTGKMDETLEKLNNKQDIPICRSLSMKELWQYCFCFTSVFLRRKIILMILIFPQKVYLMVYTPL